MLKSTRNIEEESVFRDNEIKQELGKVQIALNEAYMAKNRVEVEKEQVMREHH